MGFGPVGWFVLDKETGLGQINDVWPCKKRQCSTEECPMDTRKLLATHESPGSENLLTGLALKIYDLFVLGLQPEQSQTEQFVK